MPGHYNLSMRKLFRAVALSLSAVFMLINTSVAGNARIKWCDYVLYHMQHATGNFDAGAPIATALLNGKPVVAFERPGEQGAAGKLVVAIGKVTVPANVEEWSIATVSTNIETTWKFGLAEVSGMLAVAYIERDAKDGTAVVRLAEFSVQQPGSDAIWQLDTVAKLGWLPNLIDLRYIGSQPVILAVEQTQGAVAHCGVFQGSYPKPVQLRSWQRYTLKSGCGTIERARLISYRGQPAIAVIAQGEGIVTNTDQQPLRYPYIWLPMTDPIHCSLISSSPCNYSDIAIAEIRDRLCVAFSSIDPSPPLDDGAQPTYPFAEALCIACSADAAPSRPEDWQTQIVAHGQAYRSFELVGGAKSTWISYYLLGIDDGQDFAQFNCAYTSDAESSPASWTAYPVGSRTYFGAHGFYEAFGYAGDKPVFTHTVFPKLYDSEYPSTGEALSPIVFPPTQPGDWVSTSLPRDAVDAIIPLAEGCGFAYLALTPEDNVMLHVAMPAT